MSEILKSLKSINGRKDVVTLYYARAAGFVVVACVQVTNGGAVVIDAKARKLGFNAAKHEALASINA